MLAWFLCLIMTGSTVAGVFPERARAEAQSVNIGKVMELSKNILVDQTTVELKAKVEYTYVKSDDPSDDTKTYTRGEWVQMLAEKVEMHLDTDPDSLNHYYADTAGNAYEAAIEIAEKYGILPPPDIEDLEQDIPFSIQMNRQHANLRLIRQYMQWDSMEYIRMIRTVGQIGIVLHIKMKQQLQ